MVFIGSAPGPELTLTKTSAECKEFCDNSEVCRAFTHTGDKDCAIHRTALPEAPLPAVKWCAKILSADSLHDLMRMVSADMDSHGGYPYGAISFDRDIGSQVFYKPFSLSQTKSSSSRSSSSTSQKGAKTALVKTSGHAKFHFYPSTCAQDVTHYHSGKLYCDKMMGAYKFGVDTCVRPTWSMVPGKRSVPVHASYTGNTFDSAQDASTACGAGFPGACFGFAYYHAIGKFELLAPTGLEAPMDSKFQTYVRAGSSMHSAEVFFLSGGGVRFKPKPNAHERVQCVGTGTELAYWERGPVSDAGFKSVS